MPAFVIKATGRTMANANKSVSNVLLTAKTMESSVCVRKAITTIMESANQALPVLLTAPVDPTISAFVNLDILKSHQECAVAVLKELTMMVILAFIHAVLTKSTIPKQKIVNANKTMDTSKMCADYVKGISFQKTVIV